MMVHPQKKVLALHDLSAFGRSSLVPIISALSVMGHQCVPLPTAVFSTHTAIGGYAFRDLTGLLPPSIRQYSRMGLRFDAIYSGFVGSARQIRCISQAIRRLRASNGLVLIDPVMGDNGRLYETYDGEMCEGMRSLCRMADLITPNPTEAAVLLGRDPSLRPLTETDAAEWAAALEQTYGACVVLTGLGAGTETGILCCEHGQTACFRHEHIATDFPGTGDLFDAVLLGGLLRSESLHAAAETAACFVRDCIRATVHCGADPLCGVRFEPLLGRLQPPVR